jgi:predicted thioredoxin/glutaredoxin
VSLVLTWFNVVFNIVGIAIVVRMMFCLEEMREAMQEIKQLMGELREEKHDRLVKAGTAEWIREEGSGVG